MTSRSRSRSRWIAAALVLASSACTSFSSKTDLLDQYPPFVMQVRLDEVFTDITGATGTDRVFAYGFHPQATIDQEHAVTTAVAGAANGGAHLRIIMSKLMLGNTLQEIACRAPVNMDDGGPTIWDRVPVGDTPDDIANCAAQDQTLLPETCTGSKAVCICQIQGGCGAIAFGQPVGILDDNQDGAADAQRLVPGSVGLQCDNITVPINLNDFVVVNGISAVPGSYYDPSGFQQPPAIGGFEAMGPAIVLVPGKIVPGIGQTAGNPLPILPTSTTCTLTMTGVTDKSGTQPCTPVYTPPPDFPNCPEDDKCIADLNNPCAPGDLSQFKFGTEPFTITPQSFVDGQTGAPRNELQLSTDNEVVVDPGSVGNVTMTENGAPFTAFTVTLAMQTGSTITVTPTAVTGFDPNANFTITFQTNFTDAYGKGPAAPIVFTFMTGP